MHVRKRSLRNGALTIAMAVAVALVAAGTSQSSAVSAQKTPKKLTPFRVMVFPGATNALMLKLGKDKGYFKQHGIDLKLKFASDPQAFVPNVLSGKAEGSLWTWGSTAVLGAAKLPVKVIAPLTEGPAKGQPDFYEVISLPDSPVKTFADLEGKTLAISSVGGLAELEIRLAAKRAGIDFKKIKLVVVSFPNVEGALRSGSIDAGYIKEPWLTAAKDRLKPTVVLPDPDIVVMSQMPLNNVLAHTDYVQKNPQTIRNFQLGMIKTNRFLKNNPDEIVKALPKWNKGLDPDIVKRMVIEASTNRYNRRAFQAIANLLWEQGLLKEKINASEMMLKYPLPKVG